MADPIALLPAPRTQMTAAHAGILAKAIKDWQLRKWQAEHPVTRVVIASEIVTTTTRTVIAIERAAGRADHIEPPIVIIEEKFKQE